MSTYYFLYTEAVVDGKRVCLDGYVKRLNKDEMSLTMTYENGSRSYFGDAADEFRQLGYVVKFAELSDELKENFKGWDEDDSGCYSDIWAVDWDVFKDAVPDRDEYQYHGWVSKDDMHRYKTHSTDLDIELIDPTEFRNMSPEEKKLYEYFEYDDNMSWEYYFKIIRDRVVGTMARWESVNYTVELKDVRIIMFIE